MTNFHPPQSLDFEGFQYERKKQGAKGHINEKIRIFAVKVGGD